MSISEKQYYEAKKFMTVYSDAYQIIEQHAQHEAEIRKLQFYAKNLTDVVNKEQGIIKDGVFTTNPSFSASKIRQLSNFVNGFWSVHSKRIMQAKSAPELAEAFEKAKKF